MPNYCSLAHYNLYTRISSHRFYETVIEMAGIREKEGPQNVKISVALDASRMEKNDPTLPTLDTLRIRLYQLRNLSCKCAPTVRDQSKRVGNVPSQMNGVQGGNSKLTLLYNSC